MNYKMSSVGVHTDQLSLTFARRALFPSILAYYLLLAKLKDTLSLKRSNKLYS